jgi:hypothetical protein
VLLLLDQEVWCFTVELFTVGHHVTPFLLDPMEFQVRVRYGSTPKSTPPQVLLYIQATRFAVSLH